MNKNTRIAIIVIALIGIVSIITAFIVRRYRSMSGNPVKNNRNIIFVKSQDNG